MRAQALVLLSALVLGCSDSETTLERRGGPLPEEATGGAETGPPLPEDATGGAGGADTAPPVAFCEALTVLRAKCQRCHQDPPQNGAPVPFLTYEDTQARYYTTTKKFSDVMLSAVEQDFMPYVLLNEADPPIMPPVEPLKPEEKTTLLGWLKQGALPVDGTDCR
jgi:hypothetical protein